jgi:tRNA pseudouridine13 synthase
MNLNPPRTSAAGQLPTARFKLAPQDFVVDEDLGYEPTGEGEHIWIQVRKTGCNTRDLADRYAEMLGVHSKDIGYSGLKDKNAVTTQWFSIRQPLATELPPELAQIEGTELLRSVRSDRKLRIGSHRSNHFDIVLREVCGERKTVEVQLAEIVRRGFPNYFGEQRFGHDGRNIIAARSMFQNRRKKVTRFKRGIYLSAVRSWLFNRVLAARVVSGTWLTVQAGDVCMLNGSRSVFAAGDEEPELQRRHDEFDLHVTGPLAGSGQSLVSGDILTLEQQCLEEEKALLDGLINAGLKQERRALRAIADGLVFDWIDEQTLRLRFGLARGVYATSLLREIADISQVE